jgi:hypothetical protein
MMRSSVGIWILLFTLLGCLLAQPSERILRDVLNWELNGNTTKVHAIIGQYDQLSNQLRGTLDNRSSNQAKARQVYTFLHDNILTEYNDTTSLNNLFRNGQYNCVSANLLFALLAKDMSIAIKIWSTPFHVFATVAGNDRVIRIEMTEPEKGFDFSFPPELIVRYLLNYDLITPQELAQQGTAEIVRTFFDSAGEIYFNDLLAIFHINRSLHFLEDNQFPDAQAEIILAKSISPFLPKIQSVQQFYWSRQLAHLVNTEHYQEAGRIMMTVMADSAATPEFLNKIYDMGMAVLPILSANEGSYPLADSLYQQMRAVFPSKGYFLKKAELQMRHYKILSLIKKDSLFHAQNFLEESILLHPADTLFKKVYFIFMTEQIEAALAINRVTLAVEYAEQLYLIAGNFKDTKQILATVLAALIIEKRIINNDKEKARLILDRAVRLNPDNDMILRMLIAVVKSLARDYINAGQYEVAYTTIRSLDDIAPQDASIRDIVREIRKRQRYRLTP